MHINSHAKAPRSLDLGQLWAPSAWRAVKERAWVGVTKTSHMCVGTLVVVVVVSEVEDFSEGCFVAGISEADALAI